MLFLGAAAPFFQSLTVDIPTMNLSLGTFGFMRSFVFSQARSRPLLLMGIVRQFYRDTMPRTTSLSFWAFLCEGLQPVLQVIQTQVSALPSCCVFLPSCRVAILERHFLNVNNILLSTLPTFTITENQPTFFLSIHHAEHALWVEAMDPPRN